ncbi:MAG: lytic transglycosylase domain-containing protein [Candidatus Theseobacter exili]|nr:lytic transglycosylase domain-containing protein [Candidatus Theseobacter exili]
MKHYLIFFFLFFLIVEPAKSDEEVLSSDEVFEILYEEGKRLVQENFSDEFLYDYELIDENVVRKVLIRIKTIFEDSSIIDLAYFKEDAIKLYNFLDQYEETEPYAIWLRSRLDYFEIAASLCEEKQSAKQSFTKLSKKTPEHTPTATKKHTIHQEQPKKKAIKSKPKKAQQAKSSWKKTLSLWERKILKRSAPKQAARLVPKLKRIFNSKGIPSYWVWLAEVESSFNKEARSPVGAAGLFQIMPKTAKRFGLSLKPSDQRYNPEKSAAAAAEYLKILYRQFRSWPLAFAAYNAGEGRVGRLLKHHNGKTIEDILPYLPSETQLYVPKIIATVSVREGISIEKLTGQNTPAKES